MDAWCYIPCLPTSISYGDAERLSRTSSVPHIVPASVSPLSLHSNSGISIYDYPSKIISRLNYIKNYPTSPPNRALPRGTSLGPSEPPVGIQPGLRPRLARSPRLRTDFLQGDHQFHYLDAAHDPKLERDHTSESVSVSSSSCIYREPHTLKSFNFATGLSITF